MPNVPRPRRPPLWRRGRLWIGLAVSAVWLTLLGQLWQRESATRGRGLRQMGLSPEVLLVAWRGYEHWMWILRDGQPIGASMLSIQQRTAESPVEQARQRAATQAAGEDGAAQRRGTPLYLMTSRTRLTFRVLGLGMPIDLQTRVEMNQDFELQVLQAQALLAGQRLMLQGFVEGNDLFYHLRVAPQGIDPRSTASLGLAQPPAPAAAPASALLVARDVCGRAPLSGPIVLGDVILPVLTNAGNLAAGQTWSTQASDPVLGQFNTRVDVRVVGHETITLEGKPTPAWHLRERVGELDSSVWYDEQGTLLRRELPGGMRLERTEPRGVVDKDPGFREPLFFPPLDRERVKQQVAPELDGVPLQALVPAMPRL